jgi:hypothetical protein
MCTRFLFLAAVILLLSPVGYASVGDADDYAMVASSLAVATGSVGSAAGYSKAAIGYRPEGYSYSSVDTESTALVVDGQMAYSHSSASATAVGQQPCMPCTRRSICFLQSWLWNLHLCGGGCMPCLYPGL